MEELFKKPDFIKYIEIPPIPERITTNEAVLNSHFVVLSIKKELIAPYFRSNIN